MQKFKLYIFILGIITLFSWNNVFADSFVINLYFNEKTGKLTFDQESPQGVTVDEDMQVSIVDFVQNEDVGPYILKFYDVTGAEFSSIEFDKKNGAFNLITPYFSIAKKIEIIEKSTKKEILSQDLSQYVKCNGNGKCETDLGENFDDCMSDCLNDRSGNAFDFPSAQKPGSSDTPAVEVKKTIWQKIIDFFKNLFKG